jgi:tetratricopeptide (TPR) repeat protein
MWRQALVLCLLAAAPLPSQQRDWQAFQTRFDQLCEQGDFLAARALITSTLEDLNPADDLHGTGALLWLLGLANHVLGDFEEADLRFRAAISALERAGAPAVLTLAKAHADHASLIELRGSAREAERQRVSALGVLERELGPAHPEVLGLQGELAFGYYAQRDFARAERLCRTAIRGHQSSGNAPDFHLAKTLVTLGRVLLEDERAQEATEVFGQSAGIVESLVGSEHPMLLHSWVGLATAHIRLRRFDTATVLLHRADRVALEAFGAQHPLRIQILTTQCELLRAEGKSAEAKRLAKMVRSLAMTTRERSHSVSWSEWTAAARR